MIGVTQLSFRPAGQPGLGVGFQVLGKGFDDDVALFLSGLCHLRVQRFAEIIGQAERDQLPGRRPAHRTDLSI